MTESVQPSVSEETQQEIWSHYYGAVFAGEYHAKVGDRYLLRHKRTTTLMLLLGAGSVVPVALAFLSGQTLYVSFLIASVGVPLAVLSAITIVGEHARKAAGALSIARRCEDVSREYADLWAAASAGEVTEADARKRLARLTRILDDETARSGDIGIQTDDDRSKRLRQLRDSASMAAAELMERKYGTNTQPEAAAFA